MKEKIEKLYNNYKYYLYLSLIYVLIILFLISVIMAKNVSSKTSSEEITLTPTPEVVVVPKIKVDIKGEVIKKGVYEVDDTLRVIDVINKAGGLTVDADTSNINLSKKVKDEMVIVIASKLKEDINQAEVKGDNDSLKDKEPEINNDASIELSDDTTIVDGKVNINTASKKELTTLPGVGESKAEKIIEYRKQTLFTKIEDIINVSGIGNSVFEKIKAYITV